MANTAYISAGLPVAKNSGQSPTAGVNTAYLSAGLPAAPIFSSTLTSSIGSITSYSTSTVTNLYNQIGGKGIRRRSYSQRPNDFTIDNTHTLARGLVFAGLTPGGMVGSTRYHDSSLYGNHGTLTNMDPATDWVFDPTLGRCVLDFDGSNDYVTSRPAPSYPFALSCWVYIREVKNAGIVAINSSSYEGIAQLSVGAIQVAYKKCSQSVLGLNTWLHIAVNYASSSAISCLINGINISLTNIGYNSTNNGPSIGAAAASNKFLNGLMADAMTWNRVLSPVEIQQLADPSNVLLSGLIRPPKRTVFKSAVSNFPTTQYTRLSLCALPTRPYKGFIAKTQYTPPIIVLTRHFTPLQLFQNTI